MKNMIAIAILLLSVGTVSAQTERKTDTQTTKSERTDKATKQTHDQDAATPGAMQDSKKGKPANTKNKTTSTPTATQSTDGTTRPNGTDEKVGTPASGNINTEPTGSVKTSPGSGSPTK